MTASAAARRRLAAALALAGTLFFWGAVCAVQVLRPDLHPLHTQLSRYLNGPWGLLLHVAYYVLAVSVVLFAYALRIALPRPRRSGWLTALLISTGVAVAVAAAAEPLRIPSGGALPPAAEGIHLLASGAAFLSASAALTLAAVILRRAATPRFARGVLVLAAVENLALLSYVFAHTHYGGAQQKLVIALIVAALLAGAAQCARRDGLGGGAPGA